MFNFWGAYHLRVLTKVFTSYLLMYLRVLTETSTTHSLLHFYYSKIRGVGWGAKHSGEPSVGNSYVSLYHKNKIIQ